MSHAGAESLRYPDICLARHRQPGHAGCAWRTRLVRLACDDSPRAGPKLIFLVLTRAVPVPACRGGKRGERTPGS
jgi:hypothetical protein